MPASGCESVAIALRREFSTGSRNGCIDTGLHASAKRVLHTQVKMEPAANLKSTFLTTLKAKYTVINTKVAEYSEKPSNGNSPMKKLEASLPLPKTVLFPNEKVQLGFRGNMPVGSGMINLGNTCYLNSTLQALFHVPSFVNWLLNEPAHQKCEQYADNPAHPDDITCSVIKTLKCSQTKTGASMKPTCIYYKLRAICRHLTQGSQEDAHEFMRYLLEALEKGFLTRIQGHNLESWSKETTPINQIFGGYIRSEVSCLHCHAVSTTFQHFQDLPLDIRRAGTLTEALAGYFDRERLPSGDNGYKCEKCNRKVDATKKFSVERPPNVLCIQLKRFSMANSKLTKLVELPRLLDLSPYLSSAATVQPRHAVLYRLVSMVTHMGQSANCGHYTAIALAGNGNYYQFDDNSVRQISVNVVQTMGAYVILYELERPFHLNNNPRPTSETAAQKESESASTGGSGAKEPRRSPTAGSPAPHTAPSPGLTSLVPYNSDADSDSDSNEKEKNGWKKDPVPKSTPAKPALSTTSWRVTEVKRKTPDKTSNNGPVRTAVNGSRDFGNKPNPTPAFDNNDTKRSRVVTELMQNSHLGYGNNQIETWEGGSNGIGRQINEERKESRKRAYDDMYNAEFDRGKGKRKYHKNRDIRRNDHNPFQRRANDYNSYHRRPNEYYQKSKYHNNWKDRRHNSTNNNRNPYRSFHHNF